MESEGGRSTGLSNACCLLLSGFRHLRCLNDRKHQRLWGLYKAEINLRKCARSDIDFTFVVVQHSHYTLLGVTRIAP